MRTLFIEYSYLNGNGGGIYAARTHINLFAELSESMTLFYPYKKGKEAEEILEGNIKMIPVEDKRSKIRKFFDLLVGKVHRYKFDSKLFDTALYDVVVFDNSVVSSRMIKRFKQAGVKTITIHHNYQIEYLKGDSSRLTLLPQLFWTLVYEGDAVRNSDLNITLTHQDAELLRKHYCTTAKFAVLGVFEYKRIERKNVANKKSNHNYVISGSLATKQTEDSLISWIQEYYPLLKVFDNQAILTIAGRSPSSKLTKLVFDCGIKLIPSPSNLHAIVSESDYYICPINRGGGLKLRIMDGLKAGLPVLTHEVSARGYEKLIDKVFVISYNDQESFRRGLSILVKNNSKEVIQSTYNSLFCYDAGIATLSQILQTNHFLNI